MRKASESAILPVRRAAWDRLWRILLTPRPQAGRVVPSREHEAAEDKSAAREG